MKNIAAYVKKPHIRDRIMLIALGLFLFMPFLGSVHLFDWDEANFAEAAREMIVTGDYFRVQIDFRPFWEKPPLFFWLQALSMHVFGINEFGARFPNALCGIITLLVAYTIGTRLFSRRLGLFWALAFLGSLLPHIFFKSGVIDPVFNLLIFSGIYFISRTTASGMQDGFKDYAIAGLLIGFAVLAKGPVAFLVSVLCIGVYWASARFKPMARISQLAVFAGCVAGVSFVFYGIETLVHGTWFVREFIKYHLRLLGTSEAGHAEPFYYHFFVLLFGCFPASILAIRSLFLKEEPNTSQADFKKWMTVLFWVVLILFSIVKTKTVLYSSLTYFPITFLAAWHIESMLNGKAVLRKRLIVALCVFGALIGLIFAALPFVIMNGDAIAAHINDEFTAANLAKPVAWSGYESIVGFALMAAIFISVFIAGRIKRKTGFMVLLITGALSIEAIMIVLVGRIENHMQRTPIEFYTSLEGKDVYVKPMFKTFAHLFYTKKQPPENPHSYDRQWLLEGAIDKPAYFIARIHTAQELAEKYSDLVTIKSEGGFVFYRRDPPSLLKK